MRYRIFSRIKFHPKGTGEPHHSRTAAPGPWDEGCSGVVAPVPADLMDIASCRAAHRPHTAARRGHTV